MDELLGRAYRAYFMTAAREQYNADMPSERSSGMEDVDGKDYVVLRNVRGVLAVYRVRYKGDAEMLKRLRRWPADLGTTGNGRCADDWRYATR
jgi:hypothetical protein